MEPEYSCKERNLKPLRGLLWFILSYLSGSDKAPLYLQQLLLSLTSNKWINSPQFHGWDVIMSQRNWFHTGLCEEKPLAMLEIELWAPLETENKNASWGGRLKVVSSLLLSGTFHLQVAWWRLSLGMTFLCYVLHSWGWKTSKSTFSLLSMLQNVLNTIETT